MDRARHALDDGDECVVGAVIAAVLDHPAGMADRGAIAAKGLRNLAHRHGIGDMADIHGHLAHMARCTPTRVLVMLEAGGAQKLLRQLADDHAQEPALRRQGALCKRIVIIRRGGFRLPFQGRRCRQGWCWGERGWIDRHGSTRYRIFFLFKLAEFCGM